MDPTDPLVTVEDLRDYMSNISLTGYQQDAAQDIIDGIIGQIEAYLGRPVVVEERTDWATGGWLPATPVLSIAAFDGVTYDLNDPGRFRNGQVGTEVLGRYIGGLAADPSARRLLRITILRAAADEMTNRHDDTVSVKDLDIREPGGNDGQAYRQARGVTPDALAPLRRWKRHAVFQRAGVNPAAWAPW